MLGTSSEYGNDAIVAIGSSNWSGSDLIRDLEVRLLELSRLTELDLKVQRSPRGYLGKL